MSQSTGKPARQLRQPVPTWEIAQLFPMQGEWSEEEYLALDGNHFLEFSHGVLEVLPMPTTSHQLLVVYLLGLVASFMNGRELGTALPGPLRVRLWRRKFREPDVVVMLKEHADRMGEEFWDRADLVMEVVSGGARDRHRDLVLKRREYARAGIPEYWIVDPQDERIIVLRLAGKHYVVHGEFAKGATATSALLPNFSVDVTEVFAQQTGRPSTTRKSPKSKRLFSRE